MDSLIFIDKAGHPRCPGTVPDDQQRGTDNHGLRH